MIIQGGPYITANLYCICSSEHVNLKILFTLRSFPNPATILLDRYSGYRDSSAVQIYVNYPLTT